jgi:beta-galactosidase
VLKAVGTNDGKVVAEFALTTAGPPARIDLLPDVAHVGADGVCHIEFRIVDARGVRVPDADALVTFAVDGPARVLGIGNGNVSSIDAGQDPAHRAYQGRGLAILQATNGAGPITLRASAPGLGAAVVTIAR